MLSGFGVEYTPGRRFFKEEKTIRNKRTLLNNAQKVVVVGTSTKPLDKKRYGRNAVRVNNPALAVMHDSEYKPTCYKKPNNILAAGKLSKNDNGFDALLSAWAKLAPVHSSWHLTVWGDGANKTALKNFIKKYNLQDSTEIVDATTDLSSLLCSADIYVHPNTTSDGVYQARVRDTGSGAEVDYAKPADSYKPLAPLTSCTNSVVSDGTTMNYIFLPGGTNFTTGFTFSFLSGGEIKKTASANVSNAVKNIAPGYILKLGDISSHLKNYVAPSSHNATHPEITGATDLSAGGTANSYIVDGSDASNKGKVFKFKAYKGNTSNGVGVINSVEIVWETWDNGSTPTANSVIKAVDFDKQSANDYYEICFQMPTESLHAGNALIAAKNAGGDIIWSWHIWVPSTTIENVDGTNICGATIMDRNLGALEVTPSGASDVATLESLGLMYQWGRKDPFPGARALEKWPYSAKVAGTDITVSDAAISMAYAIAHPTVYGNSGGDDWQDVPDDARWTSSKNVNDPCPPGYKIPYAKKDSKPLWNTSSIATAVSDASLGWEVSTTGYWVKISDGANVIVIPLAGYVEENGDHYYLTHVTDRGALWFVANTTSKYHVNLRTEGTYVAQGTQAARGCGIRCVVE